MTQPTPVKPQASKSRNIVDTLKAWDEQARKSIDDQDSPCKLCGESVVFPHEHSEGQLQQRRQQLEAEDGTSFQDARANDKAIAEYAR